jgi:hypothetical protein
MEARGTEALVGANCVLAFTSQAATLGVFTLVHICRATGRKAAQLGEAGKGALGSRMPAPSRWPCCEWAPLIALSRGTKVLCPCLGWKGSDFTEEHWESKWERNQGNRSSNLRK